MKKTKTVAQKRYQQKKARKHKVLVAARKASAPKNKDKAGTLGGEGDVEGGSEDDSDESEDGKKGEDVVMEITEEPVAGPSITKVKFALPPTEAGDEELDPVAEKERRKREKREKRANRHLAKPDSDITPLVDSVTPTEAAEIVSVEEAIDPAIRSPTPPLLEAFPLPTLPPAPKASVLSRQGLPAGLENATFVDQDDRISLDSFVKTDGTTYLSDGIKTRLGTMGISDFFAGMLFTC